MSRIRDATVVARLLAAGATIAGKTVCENLCFSGASHTAATGSVRNPWDQARTTGGSSSGSAALVAAGAVDLAIGGDQGGSVRLPAAFTGIVGHKPTHGLVPCTGAFPHRAVPGPPRSDDPHRRRRGTGSRRDRRARRTGSPAARRARRTHVHRRAGPARSRAAGG